MKLGTDGQDMIFAIAGVVWGAVTVYRGLQNWRGGSRYPVHALPIGRLESPGTVLTGLAVSLGCLGYLLYSICL